MGWAGSAQAAATVAAPARRNERRLEGIVMGAMVITPSQGCPAGETGCRRRISETKRDDKEMHIPGRGDCIAKGSS